MLQGTSWRSSPSAAVCEAALPRYCTTACSVFCITVIWCIALWQTAKVALWGWRAQIDTVLLLRTLIFLYSLTVFVFVNGALLQLVVPCMQASQASLIQCNTLIALASASVTFFETHSWSTWGGSFIAVAAYFIENAWKSTDFKYLHCCSTSSLMKQQPQPGTLFDLVPLLAVRSLHSSQIPVYTLPARRCPFPSTGMHAHVRVAQCQMSDSSS